MSSSTKSLCVLGTARLHVVVDWRDVIAGKGSHLAMAHTFPPVGVGVVQNVDDLPTPEAQLALLLRLKVKQRLDIQMLEENTEKIHVRKE